MHDECDECVHGAEYPAAITEDGECHGKWIFKSKAEAQERGGLDVGFDALVVPPGLEPIGTPPRSWRIKAAQVTTVGEMKMLLAGAEDDMPLMVRNGPLPTLYVHHFDGVNYLELD